MIDELLRKVADCLGQEIQEDARVEICLTVFGREHLVIESFSVRLAKALAIPHRVDDDSPNYKSPELAALKDRGFVRVNDPRKVLP